MKTRFVFAWFDMWIGAYWDAPKRRLYVFPIPMFGVVFDWKKADADTLGLVRGR